MDQVHSRPSSQQTHVRRGSGSAPRPTHHTSRRTWSARKTYRHSGRTRRGSAIAAATVPTAARARSWTGCRPRHPGNRSSQRPDRPTARTRRAKPETAHRPLPGQGLPRPSNPGKHTHHEPAHRSTSILRTAPPREPLRHDARHSDHTPCGSSTSEPTRPSVWHDRSRRAHKPKYPRNPSPANDRGNQPAHSRHSPTGSTQSSCQDPARPSSPGRCTRRAPARESTSTRRNMRWSEPRRPYPRQGRSRSGSIPRRPTAPQASRRRPQQARTRTRPARRLRTHRPGSRSAPRHPW